MSRLQLTGKEGHRWTVHMTGSWQVLHSWHLPFSYHSLDTADSYWPLVQRADLHLLCKPDTCTAGDRPCSQHTTHGPLGRSLVNFLSLSSWNLSWPLARQPVVCTFFLQSVTTPIPVMHFPDCFSMVNQLNLHCDGCFTVYIHLNIAHRRVSRINNDDVYHPWGRFYYLKAMQNF